MREHERCTEVHDPVAVLIDYIKHPDSHAGNKFLSIWLHGLGESWLVEKEFKQR